VKKVKSLKICLYDFIYLQFYNWQNHLLCVAEVRSEVGLRVWGGINWEGGKGHFLGGNGLYLSQDIHWLNPLKNKT
jgi:hypothetical protein